MRRPKGAQTACGLRRLRQGLLWVTFGSLGLFALFLIAELVRIGVALVFGGDPNFSRRHTELALVDGVILAVALTGVANINIVGEN